MTVYLALKHKLPQQFMPRFFASLICARLVTKYYHGGIVIDGILYESTAEKGVSSKKFNSDGWDLFEVKNLDSADVSERFTSVLNFRYDWFSLFAFVLPVRSNNSKWFYCYELCWFLLRGVSPSSRITPESLLVEVFDVNKFRAVDVVYGEGFT